MPERFARNSALSAAAGISTTLGGVLSSVVVARLLGVEGLGVVAFATWIATIAILLGDLGIPGVLTRYLPELHARGEREEAGGLARAVFWPFMAAVLAISVSLAGYAVLLWRSGSSGALWISPVDFLSQPLFWLLVALSCLAQALANYFIGWLRGMQRFGRMARLALLSGILHIGFTTIGAAVWGIAGALTGSIAGSILPAVLAFSSLSKPGTISPDLKRRVVHFALGSWAYYIVTVFAWSRMEIFFLERSWGSGEVGLFAVALTLANLATQGPLLLTGALLPYLSERAVSKEQTQEIYAAGLRLMALIVMPACLGLAAIAPELVPLIYGDAFRAAVPSVCVLLVAASISGTAAVAITYLLAMEQTRFAFIVGGVGAALSIMVGLTLIPAYGTMAAAAGRGGIQILTAAAFVWYIAHRLRCPAPLPALARIFTAASISAIVAGLCQFWLGGPASLVLAIPAAILTYGVSIRLLSALPNEDIERLVAATSLLPTALRYPAALALRFLSNGATAPHAPPAADEDCAPAAPDLRAGGLGEPVR